MKKIIFLVLLAVVLAACGREEMLQPEGGQWAEALGGGYLVVDADTLELEEVQLSEYDGCYEYAFIPNRDRIFALVSASRLSTGEYAFVPLEAVYAGREGVAGIRPSTCAPEYYSQGTLRYEQKGNGGQFDFECSTMSGSTIKGHFAGRVKE